MTPKAGRPFGTFKGKHPVRVGGKPTKLYSKWSSMNQRCTNQKHPGWQYYGGRGIVVCERWKGWVGFQNFCEDMGEPNGLTLDRINNDGNYEPGNCRWATMKQQCANKRCHGPSPDPDSLRQKSFRAGLPYMRVYQRIFVNGWTEEKALSTPLLKTGAQPGHRYYGGGAKRKSPDSLITG